MRTRMQLTALIQRYLYERGQRQELSPSTVRTQRHNLLAFARHIGNPSLDRLNRRQVERWIEECDLAPSTIRTQLSQLRTFCRWCLERGYLKKDPMLGVRPPRQPRLVPRGLQRDEVRAVLRACPDSRARLVVLLMVQEGLRRKEVVGMTLGDIDYQERLVLVRGKGGHERVLPLSHETLVAMAVYLAEYPAHAGPLIRSYNDRHRALHPDTVGILVSRIMADAGVKQRPFDGRSGHSLRHTSASDMLRAGAHLRDVQQAMGHVSIQTTQRYLPWLVRDLREAMGGRRYASS